MSFARPLVYSVLVLGVFICDPFIPRAAAAQAVPASAAAIRVLVVEARTGAPLPGVMVRLLPGNLEQQTDADGRVTLPAPKPGSYRLQVSLVSFAYLERTLVVEAGKPIDLTIPLAEGSGAVEEHVTVRGDETFGAREPGAVSQSTIGGAEMRDLRGVAMDDPLRAVQALPGVASSNDFSAIFSVRGQAPRKTQMLLDGVPASAALMHTVDNPEWGSGSLLNGEVLEGATLLRGAYPQRYGGGVGPQLQLRTRNGSTDRVRVQGLVSGSAASGIVEGPIGRDGRGSWLAEARQSYIGLLVNALQSEEDKASGETGTFWFFDAMAKGNYALTPAHRLEAVALGGYFNLDFEENEPDPFDMRKGTNRSTVQYVGLQSTFGPRLVLQQRGYVVTNRMTGSNQDREILATNSLQTFGYRADLTATLASAWSIDAGGSVDTTRQKFENLAVPVGQDVYQREHYDARANAQSAYAQVRWQGPHAVSVSAGNRIDHASLSDSVTSSPWAQAEWALTPDTLVRGGIALAHEAPTIEQARGLYAGTALKSERVWTTDFSVERRLHGSTRVVGTVFTRRERDVIFRRDAEPRLVNGVEVPSSTTTRFENALRGSSHGYEIMLQRRTAGRVNGWVSYAYAKTEYRDPLRGETFRGDYDQPHTFNAHLTYRISHKQNIGVKYTYGSNFPVRGYYRAGPILDDDDKTPTYVVGGVRNETRLPLYSRVDLRYNRTFTYGRSRMTLFAEVMNLTNHANFGPTGVGAVEKMFPLLPSAGLLWEF